MGESSANEGGKTDCQSDQKFNRKVPLGYDTKIGPHTGSDAVQVAEDYHPPDPDYWEEIMPQFDLDDATVEADLIVEEVSCNMIELVPENDVSQWDDKSCVEDCFGQLCASTFCGASPHAVQLRPDGISDTSMITSNFDGAVGFPSHENISFFNEKKVCDEESIQLLTSGGTQFLGKSTVNSVCDRGSPLTGKNSRLPEPLINTRGESQRVC